MEIRLFSREELWTLLETQQNIYSRYAIVSDSEIQSKLPGVITRELPMMWLLDSTQVDMLNLLSHTSDPGWFCSVRNSALSLTLTKSLYTECGLQCKKTRDVTKTRDLFVFSCDLSELSAHNRTKLTYCFTNVLKHDYTWYFSDATPASQVSKSAVQVPVSIDTTEDLQEVVDSVGAQLLRITPGSHDSAVNTLTWEQHHSSVPCWSYHSDCCATGPGICHVIRDYKDNVRFLNLVLLRTTSESSKHVTCYFSGSDDVYLLQYDVR